MTVNLLTLFGLLTLYLFVGAKFEKRRLEYEFGDTYRSYRSRVPMILPRLGPEKNH